MKKLFLLILTFGICTSVFSTEIVNLKDGRRILVKDDYTWEEIAPAIIGEDKNIDTEDIQAVETKTLLEKHPELLKEDIIGGVSVSLISTEENSDNYTLSFEVRNQGTSSVIRVDGTILLLDDEGNVLKFLDESLYKGYYRLADTYIRVGQTREASIKIDKLPLWNGKIRVILKEVENR